MSEPLIGIIGGMGPHAGIHLAERITAETVASGDADHLSLALLSLPGQIPDRTPFLLGDSPIDPSPVIESVARRLIGLGATVIGIPCNTAHAPAIFAGLQARLGEEYPGVPVLHLIEETARFCHEAAPGARRIGILATKGTYRTNMYETALLSEGLKPVVPEEAVRNELVHRALYDAEFGIKTESDPVSEEAIELLELATEHLIEAGAEAVILGCTELPLAIRGRRFAGLPVVDSTTALARALIRAAAPERLRPLPNM